VLTRDVISETAPAFDDLRIFDGEGLEVPYVIYPRRIPGRPGGASSFDILSFEQGGEWEEFVLRRSSGSGFYDVIEIKTAARNFKKAVRVEKGDDGKTWEPLTSDAVFDFSDRVDLRKTAVALPRTKAPFLRLLLRDDPGTGTGAGQEINLNYEGLEFSVQGRRKESFRIDGVVGRGERSRPSRPLYDRAAFARPEAHLDEKGDTLISLGRVNLPLAEVTLGVDRPFYHRHAEVLASPTGEEGSFSIAGGGRIYSIPGMSRAETRIALGGRRLDYVRVRIVNEDNPPLEVLEVGTAWLRQDLYFLPERGRTYSLYFSGGSLRRPRYEVGMLLSQARVDRQEYEELTVGKVRENSGYRPPEAPRAEKEKREKHIFTAVILFLVGLMGFWVYRLVRKLPAASS
jgi:hypothetical protein